MKKLVIRHEVKLILKPSSDARGFVCRCDEKGNLKPYAEVGWTTFYTPEDDPRPRDPMEVHFGLQLDPDISIREFLDQAMDRFCREMGVIEENGHSVSDLDPTVQKHLQQELPQRRLFRLDFCPGCGLDLGSISNSGSIIER